MEKIKHNNKDNDHPNSIWTNLSRNDIVKVKEFGNKRMKEKMKSNLEGFFINFETTLNNISNLVIPMRYLQS